MSREERWIGSWGRELACVAGIRSIRWRGGGAPARDFFGLGARKRGEERGIGGGGWGLFKGQNMEGDYGLNVAIKRRNFSSNFGRVHRLDVEDEVTSALRSWWGPPVSERKEKN